MGRSDRRKLNRAVQGGGVFLGYVHGDHVDAAWHNSMMALLWHDHQNDRRLLGHGGYIQVGSGPRIASSRNKVVRNFLAQGPAAEWLLGVDTDMVAPPETLDRMLEIVDPVEVPMLGALCFAGGKGALQYPTVYGLTVEDGVPKSHRIIDVPEDTLVKVDGTGAAYTLIHRTVFERVYEKWSHSAYPWYAETEYNGEEFGEDITFCLRVRQCDIPIHVHTGIEASHRKYTELNLASYKRQQERVEGEGEAAIFEEFIAARKSRV